MTDEDAIRYVANMLATVYIADGTPSDGEAGEALRRVLELAREADTLRRVRLEAANLPDSLHLTRGMLSVWGELVEAHHGLNQFGGDTVELYVYRLAPVVVAPEDLMSRRDAGIANAALLELLQVFMSTRNVAVRVDGQAPGAWMVTCDNRHRWHIRVDRTPRNS